MEGIKKSLLYLLSNPDIAKEMGEKGCQKVKDNFSSQKMARDYIDVYKELIQTH